MLAEHVASSGLIALTVGLGAFALALYAAGFTAFVRTVRRKTRGVPLQRR